MDAITGAAAAAFLTAPDAAAIALGLGEKSIAKLTWSNRPPAQQKKNSGRTALSRFISAQFKREARFEEE